MVYSLLHRPRLHASTKFSANFSTLVVDYVVVDCQRIDGLVSHISIPEAQVSFCCHRIDEVLVPLLLMPSRVPVLVAVSVSPTTSAITAATSARCFSMAF